MGKKCAFPDCNIGTRLDRKKRRKSNKRNLSLFKAPKDLNRFQQWKCSIKDLRKIDYVCELHFLKKDIVKADFITLPNGTVRVIPHERPQLMRHAIPITPNEENKHLINTEKDAEVIIEDRIIISDNENSLSEPCGTLISETEVAHMEQVNYENVVQDNTDKIEDITIIISEENEHSLSQPWGTLISETEVTTEVITLNDVMLFFKFQEWPQTWSWVLKDNQLHLIQMDSHNFTRKVHLVLSEDLSFSIRTYKGDIVPTEKKVTSLSEIFPYLESFNNLRTCSGIYDKNHSRADGCTGFVEKNGTNYRQRLLSKCTACRKKYIPMP